MDLVFLFVLVVLVVLVLVLVVLGSRDLVDLLIVSLSAVHQLAQNSSVPRTSGKFRIALWYFFVYS